MALVTQLQEGLLEADAARVREHFRPEAGVEQVHHRVLRAADVQVDRQPVIDLVAGGKLAVVVRIGEAQEVPGGAGGAAHGIRLTARGAAAAGAGGVDELGDQRQRRLAGAGRLVVVDVGQQNGQLLFRDGQLAAGRAVNDRDRRAPVALAADEPVAQPVADPADAFAGLLEPGDELVDRLAAVWQAVERAGVDHRAGLGQRLGHLVGRGGAAGDLVDEADGQAILARELEVALIVGRDGHDCAGAVAHQNVVGDPDRDWHVIGRVDSERTGEDARLGSLRVDSLDLRCLLGPAHIGFHFGLPVRRGQCLDERVLRRQDHERRAEQGVRAGGEDADGGPHPCPSPNSGGGVQWKRHLGALAAADPLPLHLFDALGPVDGIEIGQEAVGVGRDLQVPLRHGTLLDRRSTAPAATFLDLFVSQAGLTGRAPVDRGAGAIGQPAPVEEEEDPLRPAVIIRQAGVDLPIPVIAGANALQRALIAGGELRYHLSGIAAEANRLVFGRLAEGVPAHRVQDVEAGHALETAEGVSGDVVLQVPDVETRAGGVREELQTVELRLSGMVRGAESALRLPPALPF